MRDGILMWVFKSMICRKLLIASIILKVIVVLKVDQIRENGVYFHFILTEKHITVVPNIQKTIIMNYGVQQKLIETEIM